MSSLKRYIEFINSYRSMVTKDAGDYLTAVLYGLLRRLAFSAKDMANMAQRIQTINPKGLQFAVKSLFPPALYEAANEAALQSVRDYQATATGTTGERKTRSSRAGLRLSVARIENVLRQETVIMRISDTTAVYATAILEFLLVVILNATYEISGTRLLVNDINATISNNPDLYNVLRPYMKPSVPNDAEVYSKEKSCGSKKTVKLTCHDLPKAPRQKKKAAAVVRPQTPSPAASYKSGDSITFSAPITQKPLPPPRPAPRKYHGKRFNV